MEDSRITAGTFYPEQDQEEYTLRPRHLEEFLGQDRLKENLGVFIQAARGRQESLDHVFFSGPPGLLSLIHI